MAAKIINQGINSGGSKPKRHIILVVTILLAVLIIASTLFLAWRGGLMPLPFLSTGESGASCSTQDAKIASRLVSSSDEEIKAAADRIKKANGYDKNAACLYGLAKYEVIVNKDGDRALGYLKQLQGLEDKDAIVNVLGYVRHEDAISILENDVDRLNGGGGMKLYIEGEEGQQ